MKDGKADQSGDSLGNSLGGSTGDSKEKWITIDRLCDAYEAALQDGSVERAPFLAGVPSSWREELVRELDAIDSAYRDSEETHEDTLASSIGSKARARGASDFVGLPKLESKSVWLGRFEIQKRLGSGATGSVWSARDARLARWVALKVPHASRAMSETTASRFQTEARAAAAITHPNVVQVHEVLLEDGLPILVQQWIDGPSLAAYLKEHGHLDFDLAADWMIQIADAVACAHGNGIVHRDLKPANVMIRKENPMVLDFGLASYPEFSSGLTTEGTVLGTPAYMSPEQADGFHTEAKPTTDIYSMGVILYEMLVGTPPFVGKTKEVLQAVKMTMPTSPRSCRSGLPRDLETIVMRCLRKSPSARYASAADLRDDLRRFRKREPIRARQIGPLQYAWSWCKVRPARSLAILAITLISWLLVSVWVSWHDQNQLFARAEQLETSQSLNERMRRELVSQQYTMKLARASQEMASGHRLRGKELLEGIPATFRNWEWRLLDGLSSSPCEILDSSVADEQPIGGVTSIAATRNRRRLFAATEEGLILAWEAKNPPPRKRSARRNANAQDSGFSLESVFGAPVTLCKSESGINAIAISPNERFLAWVEQQGPLAIWDLQKGKLLERIPHSPLRPGYALDFSTDSKTLVVGGAVFPGCEHLSQRISWLESYTVGGKKRPLKHRSGHAWYEHEPITSIQFTDDDRFFLTRGGREVRQVGTVEEWSLVDSAMEQKATISKGFGCRGLDFHPGNQCLSWCDGAGVMSVYSLLEKVLVCRQRVSEKPLLKSAFSKDGNQLAVVSEDLVVSRWNVTTSTLADIDLAAAKEKSDEEEPDSKASGEAKPVRGPLPHQLRRIAAATLVREYRGHDRLVNDVLFLPSEIASGSVLMSCSNDGTVRAWSKQLDVSVEQIQLRQQPLVSAQWLASDRVAVLTSAKPFRKVVLQRQKAFAENGIQIEHVHSRFPKSIVALPVQMADAIESPSFESIVAPQDAQPIAQGVSQSRFLVRCRDAMHILRTNAAKPIAKCAIELKHLKQMTAVCALSEQQVVFATSSLVNRLDTVKPLPSGSANESGEIAKPIVELHLFNLESDEYEDSIVLENFSPIRTLDLSHNGLALVAGLDSGEACWMPVTVPCPEHVSMIDSPTIAWNSDHRKTNDAQWLGASDRVATVGDDGTCAIWNFQTVLQNPDLSCTVSTSASPTLQHRLRVSSGPVTRVHSSLSGQRIATVGTDRVIRVWDTDSGLELLSLRARNADVLTIEFSPDESFLLIAESDSRLELIKL